MSELIFDDSILRGTEEEVAARVNALKAAGCAIVKRSITGTLRAYLDAPVKRNAKKDEAPYLFSNGSFIHWCFERLGIRLSHMETVQIPILQKNLSWADVQPWNLVRFRTWSRRDVTMNGVATESRTIVYGCKRTQRIVERHVRDLARYDVCGISRVLQDDIPDRISVVRLPPGRGLEPTRETIEKLLVAHLPGLAAE